MITIGIRLTTTATYLPLITLPASRQYRLLPGSLVPPMIRLARVLTSLPRVRLLPQVRQTADRQVPHGRLEDDRKHREPREAPDHGQEAGEAEPESHRDDGPVDDPAVQLRAHPSDGFDVQPGGQRGQGDREETDRRAVGRRLGSDHREHGGRGEGEIARDREDGERLTRRRPHVDLHEGPSASPQRDDAPRTIGDPFARTQLTRAAWIGACRRRRGRALNWNGRRSNTAPGSGSGSRPRRTTRSLPPGRSPHARRPRTRAARSATRARARGARPAPGPAGRARSVRR